MKTSEKWCPEEEPGARVLEIRVHGVNNTKPAVMLDADQTQLTQISPPGPTAFWRLNTSAESTPRVPPGVQREAYSWGGLVRSPDAPRGQQRLAAFTLAFQILALPFRIGNVTIWTRQLTMPGVTGWERIQAGATAAAARLFGLILTLLFAMTAAIVMIDLVALQCVVGRETCFLIPDPIPFLTTQGRVLAVASLLGPIAAVGALAYFAKRSRKTYDMLGEHTGTLGDNARAAMRSADEGGYKKATKRGQAIIAHAAFWSNRITAHLARVHLAAAIALTTGIVALHVTAERAAGLCQESIDACAEFFVSSNDRALSSLFVAAVAVLLLAVVAACALPTMAITQKTKGGGTGPALASWTLIIASVLVYAGLFIWLFLDTTEPRPGERSLFGAQWLVFVLVAIAAGIAATGLVWRRDKVRQTVAWAGTGPAIFMTLSLGLAVVTSAATITIASILLRWRWGDLLADVPLAFAYPGGLCAIAIAAVGVSVWVSGRRPPRRTYRVREEAWIGPRDISDDLSGRIESARRAATVYQSVEFIALVLCALLAAALAVGLVIAGLTLTDRPTSGFGWLPNTSAIASMVVGVFLTGIVYYFTRWKPFSSLVAIVWDVACFLPRTAQPFGPPCYAELAVPQLAQRILCWLEKVPARTVVLSAHSMGAVIAVASLGLLRHAEGPDEKPVLPRIALLTYGVQLRTYFGRILPELMGPKVLGVFPARMPSPWGSSPWSSDDDTEHGGRDIPRTARNINGTLLPGEGIRWVSLWRLTDYLGFPAFAGWRRYSPARGGVGSPEPAVLENEIDRYAEEYRDDGDEVDTHSFYERSGAYAAALTDLVSHLEARVGQT
ncbi:hypothetical protein P0L94_10285 [Microbacter sp. GSS18]|nr:hypothetical protein P0L94_10285 [Microbacter sp. GSS18]